MNVVYVPEVSVVPRDEGLVLAARWLLQESRTSGRRPLVVVPVKDSIRNSPVLETLVNGGVEVQTQRTLRGGAADRVVLAVWPDEKTLHELTSWGAPHAIGVVQWGPDPRVADWLLAQAASDLSGTRPSFAPPSISDPVVGVALRSLTRSVNLGTGLLHPSDRSAAIQTFRILKKHGYKFSSSEIYQWAAGNGWSGDGAAQLRDVAQGVLDGRRFRGVGEAWRSDIIKLWRREATSHAAPEGGSDR